MVDAYTVAKHVHLPRCPVQVRAAEAKPRVRAHPIVVLPLAIKALSALVPELCRA